MNPTVKKTHELLISVKNSDIKEHSEGWTIKEIVGHLIDSASNNHQRFIRYSESDQITFPSYDQNECVKRASYNQSKFNDLISLWLLYNELITQFIPHIPESALKQNVFIGNFDPVTMQFLIEDYYSHMEKHRQQMLRILKQNLNS